MELRSKCKTSQGPKWTSAYLGPNRCLRTGGRANKERKQRHAYLYSLGHSSQMIEKTMFWKKWVRKLCLIQLRQCNPKMGNPVFDKVSHFPNHPLSIFLQGRQVLIIILIRSHPTSLNRELDKTRLSQSY